MSDSIIFVCHRDRDCCANRELQAQSSVSEAILRKAIATSLCDCDAPRTMTKVAVGHDIIPNPA
jgi:hypothetical protein